MSGYIQFVLIKLAYIFVPIIGYYVARKCWDRFGPWWLISWILIRTIIVLCLLEYTVLDSYDLHGWYLHAKWIVNGDGVPGRSFLTPYSILFEYLNALAVWIWDSEYSLVILFAAFECAGVMLLKRPLSVLFGNKVAVRALVMFETSTVLLESSLGTQDETILLFWVALILRVYVLGGAYLKKFASGVFALVSTKILAPFYYACFFLTDCRKGVLLLVASITVVVGLELINGVSPFNLHFGRSLGTDVVGDEILTGLAIETSSIWWYIKLNSRTIANLILASCFAATILIYFKSLISGSKQSRLVTAIACISVLGCCFQFFYPFFYRCYLIPLLPFVFVTMLNYYRHAKFPIYIVLAWGVLSVGLLPGGQRWDSYRWVLFSLFAVSHLILVTMLLSASKQSISSPKTGLVAVIDFIRGKYHA